MSTLDRIEPLQDPARTLGIPHKRGKSLCELRIAWKGACPGRTFFRLQSALNPYFQSLSVVSCVAFCGLYHAVYLRKSNKNWLSEYRPSVSRTPLTNYRGLPLAYYAESLGFHGDCRPISLMSSPSLGERSPSSASYVFKSKSPASAKASSWSPSKAIRGSSTKSSAERTRASFRRARIQETSPALSPPKKSVAPAIISTNVFSCRISVFFSSQIIGPEGRATRPRPR